MTGRKGDAARLLVRGHSVWCRVLGVAEPFEVKIMAIADGYAMVRRKGAGPFVAALADLTPVGVA